MSWAVSACMNFQEGNPLTDQPISGHVAEIVSDREVILNKGFSDGVREGMYFKIIDPTGIDVKDPITGEDLGGIKRIKIVVKAIEVAPRLTLARTFRKRTVNVGGAASGGYAEISRMLRPVNYVEQVEKLRLDEQASKPIGPSESVVAKGDPFEISTPQEAELTQTVTTWE